MTSKKTDIWMPLYVGEYIADTMHLNTEQHGAYLLMLLAAWKKQGRLPTDEESLASITKLPLTAWRKHADKLLRFFEVDGEELIHGRVVKERERAATISAKRSAAGKEGGNAKQAGKHAGSNGVANATDVLNQNGRQSQSQIPKEKAQPHRASDDAQRFDEFWQAYPNLGRRRNRKGCLAKWKARKLDRYADEILANLKALKQTDEWKRGFEPLPETYLNQDRWADEVVDRAKVVGADGEVREWHETGPGIERRGGELGLHLADFPHFPAFKDAVFKAAGHVPPRAH